MGFFALVLGSAACLLGHWPHRVDEFTTSQEEEAVCRCCTGGRAKDPGICRAIKMATTPGEGLTGFPVRGVRMASGALGPWDLESLPEVGDGPSHQGRSSKLTSR